MKTCHVTNTVLQPGHCQAEASCCELPPAHSHHSLPLRPVFPKPEAHFKSQMCLSAAMDTATRSSAHADTQQQPQVVSCVPLHLRSQDPRVTVAGKALPEQSPTCDPPMPCHQTRAHLGFSAILLDLLSRRRRPLKLT